MNRESARLYLAAARGDPLLAAWVSVLDAHALSHRADVAPHDWSEAFEELYQLGFVSSGAFNALDFKRTFHRRRPPDRVVEAALSGLAGLRQRFAEENSMPKFELFEEPTTALVAHQDRRALSRHISFERLTPRAPPPSHVLTPAPKAIAALTAIEPARPALGAPSRADLPCHDPDARRPDPRTYVEEFDLAIYCCGRPLDIIYDDGMDVSESFPSCDEQMVELSWHAVCSICKGEHYHALTRPLPAAYLPR